MGFFADAVKFMRSKVFKTELSTGGYTVSNAVNDQNGKNIASAFEANKQAINQLIDINGTSTIELSGRAYSSTGTPTTDGYSCVITFLLSDVGQGVKNLQVTSYIGFNSKPAASVNASNTVLTIRGYSDNPNQLCSAGVSYSRKINYIT